MSAELDSMYQSLLNNQVPALWSAKAYPTLKPLASFYQDMIQRIAFFRSWFDLEPGIAPKSYWMSAFFFPQGFLTSVLQTFSRKNQTPIDVLGFSFKFLSLTDPE
jgi:dynein heavy chain